MLLRAAEGNMSSGINTHLTAPDKVTPPPVTKPLVSVPLSLLLLFPSNAWKTMSFTSLCVKFHCIRALSNGQWTTADASLTHSNKHFVTKVETSNVASNKPTYLLLSALHWSVLHSMVTKQAKRCPTSLSGCEFGYFYVISET